MNSANFRFTEFSEDEMRRPTPCAVPIAGLQWLTGSKRPTMEGGSALEMDASKGQPKSTAGLDLGDKYSYPSASSTNTVAR